MTAFKVICLVFATFLSLSICLSDTFSTRTPTSLGYYDQSQMVNIESLAGFYDSTSYSGYSTAVDWQNSVDLDRSRTTPILTVENLVAISDGTNDGFVSASSMVHMVIQERIQYDAKCRCNSTLQSTSYVTSFSSRSSSKTMSSPSGGTITKETVTMSTVPPESEPHTVASQSSLPQIESGKSTFTGNDNSENGAGPGTQGMQTVLTSLSSALSSSASKASSTQIGSTLTIASSSLSRSQVQTYSESIPSRSDTTAVATQATSRTPISTSSSIVNVSDATVSTKQASTTFTNPASNIPSLFSHTTMVASSSVTIFSDTVASLQGPPSQQTSVRTSSGQPLSSQTLSNSSVRTIGTTTNTTGVSTSISNLQPSESSNFSSPDQHSTSRLISLSMATLTQTLPSTIMVSGTLSVTMVIITFVSTLFNPTTFATGTSSVPSSWASSSNTSPSSLLSVSGSDLPSSSKVSAGITLTPITTPASVSIPPVSQVPGGPLKECYGSLPQWCVYPTTSVLGLDAQPSVSTIFSLPLCACATCIMASPLCTVNPPTQTTSCPVGWLCSLTIPYPTSTAYWSIAPGLDWQSDLNVWSINPQTLTNTKTASITSLSWTASLSTSTHDGGHQSIILFPLRVWDCVGMLCDPNRGINWLDRVKCIFTLGCLNPFQGILGFPPPPPPVRPPVGPPELDYQTKPTTIQKNEEPSKSESSSRSCSTAAVTSCTKVCSTVPVSSSLSETCSQSCRTTMTCSGSGVDTTSTAPCTQIVTFETLLCKNTTISGESTTLCKTAITTTTGCQGSTTISFAACSLRQSLDPNIRKTLESWAAQYPFNPADLSSLSVPRPASTLSTPTPSITTMVPRPSASSDALSMSAAMSMSSAASMSRELESSRLSSLASVSSWSSLVSVIDSQMSAGSVALSQQSVSASRAHESSQLGAVPDAVNPSKSFDPVVDRSIASVASKSSASASAVAMASASALSVSLRHDSEASATASRIAFSLPSGMTLKPERGGFLCNVDNKDLLKDLDSPQNAEYQWIKLGNNNNKLLDVIGRFCSHIGNAVGLGSQYYVYSAIEYGLDIDTQYGANITLSVTWDIEQCVQPESNGNEKQCPTENRSTGPWWQCAEIGDGQVSWSKPWGSLTTDSTAYDKQAHDFCVASFTKAVYSCGSVDQLTTGLHSLSLGGYVSTKCLRWGVFASRISPTYFWPLMGNGTEDLGWMATNP